MGDLQTHSPSAHGFSVGLSAHASGIPKETVSYKADPWLRELRESLLRELNSPVSQCSAILFRMHGCTSFFLKVLLDSTS